MVEKAQKEVENMIREEGEAATLEVGVHGIHPELGASPWTYEVPYQLWTECTETFHRGGTAFRTSGRRDRCGYPHGKTCRTSA